MSKRQTARIIFNATPEQKAAFDLALSKAKADPYNKGASGNQILGWALWVFCEDYGVEWPDFEAMWGNIERIPSRRKIPNS